MPVSLFTKERVTVLLKLYILFEITTGPIAAIPQLSVPFPPMSNCPLNVTVRSVLRLVRYLPPPVLKVLFKLVKVRVAREPLLFLKFMLLFVYALRV